MPNTASTDCEALTPSHRSAGGGIASFHPDVGVSCRCKDGSAPARAYSEEQVALAPYGHSPADELLGKVSAMRCVAEVHVTASPRFVRSWLHEVTLVKTSSAILVDSSRDCPMSNTSEAAARGCTEVVLDIPVDVEMGVWVVRTVLADDTRIQGNRTFSGRELTNCFGTGTRPLEFDDATIECTIQEHGTMLVRDHFVEGMPFTVLESNGTVGDRSVMVRVRLQAKYLRETGREAPYTLQLELVVRDLTAKDLTVFTTYIHLKLFVQAATDGQYSTYLPPSPPPPSTSGTFAHMAAGASSCSCSNTCETQDDGVCDDGRQWTPGQRDYWGAEYGTCNLGTDCADCGGRFTAWSNEQLDSCVPIEDSDAYRSQGCPSDANTSRTEQLRACIPTARDQADYRRFACPACRTVDMHDCSDSMQDCPNLGFFAYSYSSLPSPSPASAPPLSARAATAAAM